MTQDTLLLLTEAVKARRCCAIRYRDQKQIRIVEPHVIYRDVKGEVIVDCYQTKGYSSANRTPPFWRPFRLQKLGAVALLRDTFIPRRSEGFNPTRVRYRKDLICVVADRDTSFIYPFEQNSAEPVGPARPRVTLRR